MRLHTGIALAVIAAGSIGCASIDDRTGSDWREGRVVEVKSRPADAGAGQIVVVNHLHGTTRVRATMPVAAGVLLAVGDRVRFDHAAVERVASATGPR